jgi:hypothetical protein
MNVVVLRGRVRTEPKPWTTAAGESLWSFDLVTGSGPTRAEVPVTWFDVRGESLREGDEVVVRGRVRKRFAGAAGGTRPHTDVVADQVVGARRRRQVLRVIEGACESLGGS